MAGIADDLNSIKGDVGDLRGNNQVARFAYTQDAYTNDEVAGRASFDINEDNNIPTKDAASLNTNPTVLDRGFQTQASSITRQLQNHFYGRVSYNLNKIVDRVWQTLGTLSAAMGRSDSAAGDITRIATLDANGRLPSNQLTEDAMEIRTYWDASTNSPDLTSAANKRPGNVYYVSTEGTRDIGGGSKTYYVGDVLICDKSLQWERIPVTYVKGGAENASAYRTGKADITKANVGLGNVADIDQSPGLKDLTFTASASAVTVGGTKLDGNAATLTGAAFPMASSTQAGLMSSSDWSMLHNMVLDSTYPVGILLWTSRDPSDWDPNTALGGTWVRIKDTFVYAAGDNDTVTSAQGAGGHTTAEEGSFTSLIGANNLPQHTHAIGGNTGNDSGHSHEYIPSGRIFPDSNYTGAFDTTSGMSSPVAGYIGYVKTGTGPTADGTRFTVENQSSGTYGGSSTSYKTTKYNLDMSHTHKAYFKGTLASTISTTGHTHSLPTDTGNNTTTETALSVKNPLIKRYCWERIA